MRRHRGRRTTTSRPRPAPRTCRSSRSEMATPAELLVDAFGRVREAVHGAVAGLTPEQLRFRMDEDANSIAWLVWHLARIQDDHVADVAHWEQVWTAEGWTERFGLPFDPGATGYGHSSD